MTLPPLGLDISKLKFNACLIREGGKLRHKVFPNDPAGFSQLADWLTKLGAARAHACLEATGTYGDSLAAYLHEAGHVLLQDDRQLPERGSESLRLLDRLVAGEETARHLDRPSDGRRGKKRVPHTLSGLPVAEARSVMEMEEVLVRMRASGARTSSSVAKASFLGPTFSTMASMDASTHAMSSRLTVQWMRS